MSSSSRVVGSSSAEFDGSSKTTKLTQNLVAATGEFVGTVLFLWFAFAWHLTVASQTTKTARNGMPTAETVIFIAIGYGFSLLVTVWAFYRISGALFNPAASTSLILTGNMPVIRGLYLIVAEFLGGIVAAALVAVMFPGDIASVNTHLAPHTSFVRGVFIEAFLTSLLLFVIHMLAVQKSKVTFMAPLGIGLTLFVAELAGVLYTGGSLNPARSFGPAVVSMSFKVDHLIYWIGPFLGSGIVAGSFWALNYFNWQEANPGQDSDTPTEPAGPIRL